jgi:hypothetical protein
MPKHELQNLGTYEREGKKRKTEQINIKNAQGQITIATTLSKSTKPKRQDRRKFPKTDAEKEYTMSGKIGITNVQDGFQGQGWATASRGPLFKHFHRRGVQRIGADSVAPQTVHLNKKYGGRVVGRNLGEVFTIPTAKAYHMWAKEHGKLPFATKNKTPAQTKAALREVKRSRKGVDWRNGLT